MIILTEEQKEKIKSGELTHKQIIEEHTKEKYGDVPVPIQAPVQEEEEDELVSIKRKLKEANGYYKDLITDNKRLRRDVTENVTDKLKTRKYLSQLKARKKELLAQ